MNRFAFGLSCPTCGGEVEHRESVRLSPTRTQAEVWCSTDLIVWRVDVDLTPVDVIRLMDDPRARAGLALGNDLMSVFR